MLDKLSEVGRVGVDKDNKDRDARQLRLDEFRPLNCWKELYRIIENVMGYAEGGCDEFTD
jgi:hypothetical protein